MDKETKKTNELAKEAISIVTKENCIFADFAQILHYTNVNLFETILDFNIICEIYHLSDNNVDLEIIFGDEEDRFNQWDENEFTELMSKPGYSDWYDGKFIRKQTNEIDFLLLASFYLFLDRIIFEFESLEYNWFNSKEYKAIQSENLHIKN